MSILDLLKKRKESIPELEQSLSEIDTEIEQSLEDIDEAEENIREAVFTDPKKVDQLTQTITQKRMRIEALKIGKSAVNDQIALLKKKEADAAIAAKMAEAREKNKLLRDKYLEIHNLASAIGDHLRQAKELRVAIQNANTFAVEAKRPELKVTPILSVLANHLHVTTDMIGTQGSHFVHDPVEGFVLPEYYPQKPSKWQPRLAHLKDVQV